MTTAATSNAFYSILFVSFIQEIYKLPCLLCSPQNFFDLKIRLYFVASLKFPSSLESKVFDIEPLSKLPFSILFKTSHHVINKHFKKDFERF
jgi:hypothetical protein